MKGAITGYGFRWGPVEVESGEKGKGWVVIGLKTARQTLQVYITKTGLIRVQKVRKAPKSTREAMEKSR